MRTIHKYPLEFPQTAIRLGKNDKPLAVAMQGESMCMWVEVNVDDPVRSERHFRVFPTGAIIDRSPRQHVGTVIHAGFVWHIYEELA
jgi:hypothetical protein